MTYRFNTIETQHSENKQTGGEVESNINPSPDVLNHLKYFTYSIIFLHLAQIFDQPIIKRTKCVYMHKGKLQIKLCI